MGVCTSETTILLDPRGIIIPAFCQHGLLIHVCQFVNMNAHIG